MPPIACVAVALYVQKFGGTSVGTPDRIREVADHAARCVKRGDQVVLVVSAMGKETDELLRLADDVSTSKPGREMDMLITGGERKACALVAMALTDLGIESESFTGSQAGFLTDTTHRNAKILEVNPRRIADAVAAGKVPVVGGSQGVSTDHDVTFFGRGGSDTTAVALAHALDADACELYTDVPGVFTTDPRLVPEARKMDHISFDELLEMTADIVSAYVGNNTVTAEALPALIANIHAALSGVSSGPVEAEPEPKEPAVPIRKSINPDFLICLEDGRKFKSLKRHLRTKYDMSPEEYRAKWNLPKDYPMVAPNYAKQRSYLAKKIGLGKRREN